MGGQVELDRGDGAEIRLSCVVQLFSGQTEVGTSEEERQELPAEVSDEDVSGVVLPEAFYARLKEAAEMHSVTDVRQCLDDVRALGKKGEQFAASLEARNKEFDMEGILSLLGKIHHE